MSLLNFPCSLTHPSCRTGKYRDRPHQPRNSNNVYLGFLGGVHIILVFLWDLYGRLAVQTEEGFDAVVGI